MRSERPFLYLDYKQKIPRFRTRIFFFGRSYVKDFKRLFVLLLKLDELKDDLV